MIETIPVSAETPGWRRIAVAVPAGFVILASALTFVGEMVRTVGPDSEWKLPKPVTSILGATDVCLLSWGDPYVLRWIRPFRSINGYGLFRVMTTERPEIAIEASHDGIEWIEYKFRWKPGELERAPGSVAPHMPRLDWQMWFAALNPGGALRRWLQPFMLRLLENEPDVTGLLEENPFADRPPEFVRLVLYEYEFTDSGSRRSTGRWWKRTQTAVTPPLTRER